MTTPDVTPNRPIAIWQHAHYRELTLPTARLKDLRHGRHPHETYVTSYVAKGLSGVRVGRHQIEVPASGTSWLTRRGGMTKGDAAPRLGGPAFVSISVNLALLVFAALPLFEARRPMPTAAPIVGSSETTGDMRQ